MAVNANKLPRIRGDKALAELFEVIEIPFILPLSLLTTQLFCITFILVRLMKLIIHHVKLTNPRLAYLRYSESLKKVQTGTIRSMINPAKLTYLVKVTIFVYLLSSL